MRREQGRSVASALPVGAVAALLGGVGLACLTSGVGRVLDIRSQPVLGTALLVLAGVGVVATRRQRWSRFYGLAVAVGSAVILQADWDLSTTNTGRLIVGSIELVMILAGLVAALAPACTGDDAGSGDDLPAVRLCVYGHRFCPFHPVAPPDATVVTMPSAGSDARTDRAPPIAS